MKFIFDNNLPKQLARAINALARKSQPFEAKALADLMPGHISDQDWLLKLGDEGGWAAVSIDANIKQRPQELAAWQASGMPFFFLDSGWSQLTYWPKCATMVRWWPSILDTAANARCGDGFIIPCREKPGPMRPVRSPA